jgi:hypothetical protein
MMFGSFRDLAFMGAALEAPPAPGLDPDAAAYIAAVEDTDGQALEAAVVDAIDAFVVGCKADGIWNAIKASCILAGARTLAGALVPLVGTAPTSFNFVDGDYNRKTGLVGDGSTKYLDSNRNDNADPQNSLHVAGFLTFVGSNFISAVGSSAGRSSLGETGARNRSTVASTGGGTALANSLTGHSRLSSSTFVRRVNGVNTSQAVTSETPVGINHFIFARNNAGTADTVANHRLAFYSIGESLDLALLDARVTALINAFDTAIPS